MKPALIGAAALAAVVASPTAARAQPAAIMVLPADAPVDAAITGAIVRGAHGVSPAVTAGSASLADTAFIAGCDPAEPRCLDAVGAQLGVQQLVIVRSRGGTVDVTATRPGAAPTRRSFPADRLGELEAAIPGLLGAPSAAGAGTAEATLSGGAAGESRMSPRGRSRAALVLAIGGGALALTGTALWAAAASTQSEIDDAPTNTAADLEHLASLERTGRTYASVGNGLFIAGSVAAVAGVGWLVWERRHRARVVPIAGPAQAGLAVEGRW